MKKMRKILLTTLVIILSISVFAACGNESTESTESTENTGNEENVITNFGSFESLTFEGDKVTESVFANSKLTMINVWGTFCGPCVNEMPDLEKLQKEYDKEEFQLIGIVSDKMTPGDESAREIIDKTGVTYLQIMNSESLAHGTLAAVQAVPTTIFVDKDGEIVNVAVGGKTYENWKTLVEQVLENM